VTYLNLLVLFLNISNNFNVTDLDSVELFLKLFGTSKIPILLIFTHADNVGSERRENIKIEIQQHPRLAKYFEDGVFEVMFSGCVNYVNKNYTNEKDLTWDYEDVIEWRDQLLSRIFRADIRTDLEQTDIYVNRKTQAVSNLELCLDEFPILISGDPDTSNIKKRLINHKDRMEYLCKHTMYLEKINDEKIKTQLRNLWGFIQDTKQSTTIEEDIKKLLLGPWF